MTNFSIAFDLSHSLIEARPPTDEEAIRVAESRLEVPLPPSYKWWLTYVADGADINAGNTLWLRPLLESEDPRDKTVIESTEFWRALEHNPLKDIVVFGLSGGDGETYAFYTGSKSAAGEYPIVWITPGSVTNEGFVILNSRFDRFLNIQVQDLLAHDSSDLDEGQSKQLWLDLYRKYDPRLPMPTDDLYELAVTAEELRERAAQLVGKFE